MAYHTGMRNTAVRTASKDILARCMAEEDIIVEHRHDIPSACFDTASRVLMLPIWQDMDNSMYDMLVGHEVSHALHTPATGWQDFIGEGPGSGNRHMFVNIVEDARIERKIKDQFPGIRRDFASAYKSLHDRDIFEIAGKNLHDLPLIDRLNLYFKIGLYGLENIPFSASEKQYVDRMAAATSFEEVVDLAKELYDLWQDDQGEQQGEQDENGQPQSGNSDDQDGEGSGSSAGNDDGDDESDSASGSADDGDEQGEDSGQSATDDTDDGSTAESTTGHSQSDDTPADEQSSEGSDEDSGDADAAQAEAPSHDDYSNDPCGAGSTQHNYEKSVDNLRNDNASEYHYYTLPTTNLDNIIVDYTDIAKTWDEYNRDNPRQAASNGDAGIIAELNQFLNRAKPTVQHMVQQFVMKQAADADKRTEISKTGILDTVRMIDYRWSEDVFLKNETHADGKNHGIVMFIDWSGSMSGILKDTVDQLIILTEFCRKASIPFEVYAFTSILKGNNCNNWRGDEDTDDDKKQFIQKDESDLSPRRFQLNNFLSSRMDNREYKTALQNLYRVSCSEGYGNNRVRVPYEYHLGSTPLNEAVIAALDIVPAFQNANSLQIVNAVFLTDGDGNGIGGLNGGHYDENIIRDNKTRKNYKIEGYRQTSTFLNILKDRTDCNIIGIFLNEARNLKGVAYKFWGDIYGEDYSKANASYKKNNFTVAEVDGYDVQFVVKGTVKVEFDALENLGDDASFTKIKNAFMKGSSNKKSSRVLAGRLIDIIAA